MQQWKEVDQLAGCEAVAQKIDKSDEWTSKEAAGSENILEMVFIGFGDEMDTRDKSKGR